MAAQLGNIFYQHANTPVLRALEALQNEPLEKALEALSAEQLMEAFRSGARQVAKKTAVPALRVFRLLDMELVDEIVQRVGVAQRLALSQWRSHDAGDGGLFSDQALLGDGEVGSVVDGLRRVATTLKREEQVATAFSAMADELERWSGMIDEARTRIDRAKPLARAYKRRIMVFWALMAVLVFVVVGAGTWFVKLLKVRAEIDDQLSQGDCAVEQIDSAHAARASDAQQARMRQAREACRTGREAVARAEEERRKEEALAREADKRAKEQSARCAKLGKDFAAGKLDDADRKVAGAHAALLQRLIIGELRLDDVSKTEGSLPCVDSEAGKAFKLSLAKLVVNKMLMWIQLRVPSQTVHQAIVENAEAIDGYERTLLAGHIEMTAKGAVMSGQDKDLQRHAKLCRLAFAIDDNKGVNCEAVLELAKKK